MSAIFYKDKEVSYQLSNNNVHIVDSHLIRSIDDMRAIVDLIRAEAQKLGFTYIRTAAAWVTEWKAHNWLYDHDIAKDRTGSVDLNENESTLKLIGYAILSLFYKA